MNGEGYLSSPLFLPDGAPISHTAATQVTMRRPPSSFTPARASSSRSQRFSPQPFLYNGRVASVLLPTLAIIAGYGGSIVAGILMVGFMGVYILDTIRVKEGAFAAAWITLGATNMAMIISTLLFGDERSTTLAVLIFFLTTVSLFLTGLWATLQFKWIQLQYPAVVLAFEKMVVGGCFPVGLTVLTWGIVAGVGINAAPFYMAGLGCVLYHLFARPLSSSFQSINPTINNNRTDHRGGASFATPDRSSSRKDTSAAALGVIQSPSDAVWAFFLATTLPPAVYTATHHLVLFQWVHFWSLMLLFSGPLLVITTFRDGLWWLGSGTAVDALRRLLLLLSLAAFLAGLEGRIIFYSFGQYIRLAAPWSYMAVTLTVYGLAALVLLHFSGALGQEAEGALVAPLLMLSAALGSLAAGLPIPILPAPLLAAAGMSMFYESRSMREYILFAAGAVVSGGWFLWHHFSFLDVQLDGISLHNLCILILAAMVPGVLIPGLVHAGMKGPIVSSLMVVQAVLLAYTEEKLFAGDHEEVTFNVHSMYPAFLVALTSSLGIAMTRKLIRYRVIGKTTAYVLQCAYAAKLAMLAVPEARLMLPALGLALAMSPPLLLLGHIVQNPSSNRLGGGGPIVSSSLGGGGGGGSNTSRMRELPVWAGLGLSIAIMMSVIAARFAIFDIMEFILDRRPSESLLAGSLVVIGSLGCLPLITRCYPTFTGPKRMVLLGAVFGALLILLRPPLPVKGGSDCPNLPFGLCPRIWNEAHMPDHEQDDVSIYGDGLTRREHWPLWLLLTSVMLGLSTVVSSRGPLNFIQACVAATLVGLYLALDFFPNLFVLQLIVLGSSMLAAAFLVLAQLSGRGAAVLMPVVAAAWVATYMAALLFQKVTSLPPLGPDATRLFPDSEREVEEERREALLASVLAVYAAEALLLAFTLKLRISTAVATTTSSGGLRSGLPVTGGMSGAAVHEVVDRAASFLGQCMPAVGSLPGMLFNGTTSSNRSLGRNNNNNNNNMSWAPTWCNIMTLICFSLGLWLNRLVTGGADVAIFLLAPVLLLLCQDGVLLPSLNHMRRYFPPALAIVGYLVASTGLGLGNALGGEDERVLMLHWNSQLAFVVKNALFLLLCMPNQVDFLRWLWSSKKAAMWKMLFIAPLCVVPVFAADLISVKLLAGVTIAATVAQIAGQAHTKSVGRHII
jgi:hypothetical protein